MADWSRYPLVQKALAEQQTAFAGKGLAAVPPALHKATQRALTLIEEHLPAQQAEEKDVILATAALMHCPPYAGLKSRRFAMDYDPRVQSMLDTHTSGRGVTAKNKDLIQIYSAMFVAHLENLHEKINATTGTHTVWFRDILTVIERYEANRSTYAQAIAPGLRAVENTEIGKLRTLLHARLAANNNTPYRPKKPRPPKGPKTP